MRCFSLPNAVYFYPYRNKTSFGAITCDGADREAETGLDSGMNNTRPLSQPLGRVEKQK